MKFDTETDTVSDTPVLLSPGQARILRLLQEESMTPTDLVLRHHVPPGTVSVYLRALLERNLVTCERLAGTRASDGAIVPRHLYSARTSPAAVTRREWIAARARDVVAALRRSWGVV